MSKVKSKSAKSSAKLHHTPPFSKEYTKYVDIDFSKKGRKWSNIFSLLLLLLVIGSIGTLIFLLMSNTNNNDNDNDNDKDDI